MSFAPPQSSMSTDNAETKVSAESSVKEEVHMIDKPAIDGDSKGNIQLATFTGSSANEGIPETFIVPPPLTSYQLFRSELEKFEQTQEEFDKWKLDFTLRACGKTRPEPTSEELADYFARCRERERLERYVRGIQRNCKEYRVTSLPKDVLEAQELFDEMLPWRRNLFRPKDHREGIALAAPGGVVDEEKLDDDAMYIKQYMMAEKQMILEDVRESNDSSKQGAPRTAAGKRKKKKNGHGKGQGKNDANESKGAGNERDNNPRIIPIEETLWFSPPHFPRLAKTLVYVCSQLEKRIGTDRAVAALHTAITDEALNVETVSDILDAEGQYHYDKHTPKPQHPRGYGELRKAISYLERAVALGHELAHVKLAMFYRMANDDVKSRTLLIQACDKGIVEPGLYASLGLYYLEGIGGPPDGKKADFYLRQFGVSSDVYPLGSIYLFRARLYTFGLDLIKPDPVLAFDFITDALAFDNQLEMTWADFYTLAVGYRYGLHGVTDPKEAFKYYNQVLKSGSPWARLCAVAQPHIFRVMREAREYKEMMKRGKESLLNDPQERMTRFKLLLASLQRNHKEIQPYLQNALGYCYLYGDGVAKNLKRAEEYLVKSSQDPDYPWAESAFRLAVEYTLVGNKTEALKYLVQAEKDPDALTSDEKISLYRMATILYRHEKTSERLLGYCEKLILEKQPVGWHLKGQAYLLGPEPTKVVDKQKALQCFKNAAKLIMASPEGDDELLGEVYYDMGDCYLDMESELDAEERKGGKHPYGINGVMYLEKSNAFGIPEAPLRLAQYYFSASKHHDNEANPGNPVKAFELYKQAFDMAKMNGKVPPDICCEYGYLLLTGKGGVSDPIQGLKILESGTHQLLEKSKGELKPCDSIFLSLLMSTYEFGDYGVPKDEQKASEYREHFKKMKEAKEVPPEVKSNQSAYHCTRFNGSV